MDMKLYCHRQVEEAKKYKWIESQKAGKDLGDDATREWVNKFAAQFRKDYDKQYAAMVTYVIQETLKEMKKADLHLDDDVVKKIAKIAIDKFISKWTVDMADEKHNIHLDLL
jgi:hypothetical protein